jgi:hypothetical protein
MKALIATLGIFLLGIHAHAQQNPTMEFEDDIIEAEPKNTGDSQGRQGGSDYMDGKRAAQEQQRQLQQQKLQEQQRLLQQQMLREQQRLQEQKINQLTEVGKNAIKNYASTAADLNNVAAAPKLGLKYAGKLVKAWDAYDTYQDLKNGKWGSGVCFAVGFAPIPYGTAGSILCNSALIQIRMINQKNKHN